MIGFFVTMFWIAYAISPRFCHRFVGYLEEEAVSTYTHCLKVRLSGNTVALDTKGSSPCSQLTMVPFPCGRSCLPPKLLKFIGNFRY